VAVICHISRRSQSEFLFRKGLGPSALVSNVGTSLDALDTQIHGAIPENLSTEFCKPIQPIFNRQDRVPCE
jgi:hypothetical protein